MAESVTRINLGFVNAYLLSCGKDWVLVDTGIGGGWKRLEEGLQAAGVTPENLKLVVLTHADRDHAGNCVKLKDGYHAPIAAHSVDANVLQSGHQPPRTGRTNGARIAMKLIAILSKRGSAAKTGGFAPEIILEDGQRLDQWGLAARVIHLPGHTGGSIAVLTDDGMLIAGDACTNRKTPAPSPFIENFDDYRKSIDVMRGLAPSVKTVFPGHGSPFDGALLSTLAL